MGLLDEKKVSDDIIDVDLSETQKKRFRIDGDNDRILELNTSDLSVINRLEPTYEKLNSLMKKAITLEASESEEIELGELSEILKSVDKEMRSLIDELFDAPVSEVCAPSGTMYDPFNGTFRFEHIINVILGLYEQNMKKEFEQVKKRVSKHTKKYTS